MRVLDDLIIGVLKKWTEPILTGKMVVLFWSTPRNIIYLWGISLRNLKKYFKNKKVCCVDYRQVGNLHSPRNERS